MQAFTDISPDLSNCTLELLNDARKLEYFRSHGKKLALEVVTKTNMRKKRKTRENFDFVVDEIYYTSDLKKKKKLTAMLKLVSQPDNLDENDKQWVLEEVVRKAHKGSKVQFRWLVGYKYVCGKSKRLKLSFPWLNEQYEILTGSEQ
jgi:hypothetical protein